MTVDSENNGNYRDQKGMFLPGNPGKPKGAEIKATAKIKAFILSFLEGNVEKIQESFDSLKPIEKLQFISNLLPYAVPKLSSVQSENETKISGGINIRWEEPGVRDTGSKGGSGELQGLQSGLSDNSESRGDTVREDIHP